ncbi:MAG: PAS domain-containing protein [Sulfurimonas sp.]|jgi:PAS domain S-box-containing protein|nr:PAS domain-containing protein [Sulfurimonas sp.]MBU1217196.1 PAS domain-containing protein [bacterium]MBU1433982.1 PAS domain-containing protein [bacterium]MBU1502964.1 PAS domain-containing protein [bacterium]MBU3938256.1 PAS domain-containing protein [bacterium]
MDKVVPINEEYMFDGNVIISQTDLHGVITYANKMFCQISGYSAQELLGKPHNIIRHPDMPKAAFEKMWSTIQGGQAWNGLVKNLRKDGLYYWVETEILPIKDEEGKLIGYIAARKPASRKNIQESDELYTKMLNSENEAN